MINNPRFPFETAFNRDAMINNYFRYPLGELESVTSTIFDHLYMMAEYCRQIPVTVLLFTAKGHLNMASNEKFSNEECFGEDPSRLLPRI